ncbi:putative Meiotically up-regulated gene 89 protein [Glarea lozoyensis 74030]|uniref:Putative Meiotically up-regulated gene 89 protein n=1 Tax=Glarea lozoyensis (strain ATCC 74030 / MF5533) TaxID=1104152 RepID=H0EUC1_GLAL7|nr:putative Meiotically up-regulated gene 89 protein [Glarea lozoyensis 74030]
MADTPGLNHPDSIDSQDPNQHPDEKKPKSRRPANTAFRQQRLKAWQPILTPKTVLPLFFAIGIIFAPIGGGLLYASRALMLGMGQVQEISIDYSHCQTDAPISPETAAVPSSARYAKSFNIDQLGGKAVSESSVHSSDCTPLTTAVDPRDGVKKPYYPCGLAANSVFNDTFGNPVRVGAANDPVPYLMSNKSIAWNSDKELYGKSKYNLATDVIPPPNWEGRYPNGYTADRYPDLVEDESFQVWMRLAGLPTFSKLAQKSNDNMPEGKYQLNITSFFNVTEYGGTKSIVISTGTVMGGRNPFLGIAYVVVGGICVVLGALFLVTHLVKPRKLGDHTYLSWNNVGAHSGPSDGVLAGDRP